MPHSPSKNLLIRGFSLILLLLVACANFADVSTPVPTAKPTSQPAPTTSLTTTPTATSATDVQLRRVKLPDDEAAHGTPFEWWYFNGHLTDDAGTQYSYHFVTFEITTPEGLTPRLLQISWADHSKGVYLTDEIPSFAVGDSTPGSFDIRVSDWRMRGDGLAVGSGVETS